MTPDHKPYQETRVKRDSKAEDQEDIVQKGSFAIIDADEDTRSPSVEGDVSNTYEDKTEEWFARWASLLQCKDGESWADEDDGNFSDLLIETASWLN
jgi:hypothetical protein